VSAHPGGALPDDDPLLGEPGSDDDQRRPLDGRDFSRRTLLANERTYLAWWRTGLTTLTVALAGARVVPELSDSGTRWPYTGLGVVFALLGVLCMVYAEKRRRDVARAVRRGTFVDADGRLTLALSAVGALAGVATVLLILLDT
jgi:putative membrane protein